MGQNLTTRPGGGDIEVRVIETEPLGDRSYVVLAGGQAAVIDPQRDIDRVLAALDGAAVAIVAETHLHNDYVSGGLALSRATDARLLVPAGDEVAFDRVPAAEGDRFDVGPFALRVMATPGHTPHHVAYVLESGGRDVAVFTGGSMLYGAVGRTDLIAPDATDGLTRAQYHSTRRLAGELPADAEVLPTHGFGSFCASTPASGATLSTVGDESRANPALTEDDEDRFVERLLAGLSAYPRYYAHMGVRNREGADAPDLDAPSIADAAELARRIGAGEWVVDLRDRRAFAAGHGAGTINVALDTPFATYLGWTIPWGTPVTLVGDTPEQVAEAQRQLVRIGIDRPAAAAGPTERAGLDDRSYRVARFADLAAEQDGGAVVLDVRRPDEWKESHIAGAVHIPLYELEDRIGEIPDGAVWVHCASGYRASIAASLLDRSGREVVLVDDDWSEASGAGLLPDLSSDPEGS